mgnify:CR=1 FL=1
MPQREELHIVDVVPSSVDDECVLFVADKLTHQISFEPLSDISIDIKSRNAISHFSARSLGRRVIGFYTIDDDGSVNGEADFVTPLLAGEVESR